MRTTTAVRTSATPPLLTQVSGRASAMLRGLAIRPYLPPVRQREREVAIVSGSRLPASRLYRERGRGNQPTIVIGGFVPDATEVVEFQRPLLKKSDAL